MSKTSIAVMVFVAIALIYLYKVGVMCVTALEEDEEETEMEIETQAEEVARAMVTKEPIEIMVVEEEKEPVPVWTDIPLTASEQIALYNKCKELDIGYWFVIAMCESESSFRSDAESNVGAIGYMQIAPCNWQRMKEDYGLDVHEPIDNLLCGAHMLSELSNKYDSFNEVVMGYKCGEARAKELLQQGIVLDCVEQIGNRTIELELAHRD